MYHQKMERSLWGAYKPAMKFKKLFWNSFEYELKYDVNFVIVND